MKKYITEELDADIRAVLDKFKDSPSDIQLAIQFAKECFPNLDLNSIGPAGYPNDKSKNCMKFKSTNPANSANPIGYLCDSNGGPLVFLTQDADNKKSQGIEYTPAKKTTWTCSTLSQYKNAIVSPELQKIYDALKTVLTPENIKNYTELDKTQALQQGFYLQSLDDIYTANKQALDSIAKDVNWQFKIANKPVFFWRKGTTVDLKQDISASIVSDMQTIGATPGKCSTLDSGRGICTDLDLNEMYPGEFQGPKYYHFISPNADEALKTLKKINKENKVNFGKRDCKKVFESYINLIRTCAQGKNNTEVSILKSSVAACKNTQFGKEKFADEMAIINNPIKGKHMPMSCTKDFRLPQTESQSRLKNIIKENLIKLSIRKGLI